MQKINTFSLPRFHRKLNMIKSAKVLKNTFLLRTTEKCKKNFYWTSVETNFRNDDDDILKNVQTKMFRFAFSSTKFNSHKF